MSQVMRSVPYFLLGVAILGCSSANVPPEKITAKEVVLKVPGMH